jgi:hypothetical protein
VKHTNITETDALADEVQVDFDMLCSLMLDWIAG